MPPSSPNAPRPARRAGSVEVWIGEIRAAVTRTADADVPCDGCTACCRSSQFVHVAPDETEALARIPAELLFPAPGAPRGHVLMGFDERGLCPMLVEDRCSIYDARPRTCRAFDCRVFAATGVPAERTPLVDAVASTWVFDDGGQDLLAAARRAAAFLRSRHDLWPNRSPADTAIAAIGLLELFRGDDGPDDATVVEVLAGWND